MVINRQLRVLVVDDSIVALKAICQLLGRLGYETIAAHNGPEAMGIMESHDGFNLVLTDINMPQMDGWELARRLKAIKPEMPIVAITGESPNRILPMLGGSAIDHALFKPFVLEHLNNVMKHIFGSE
jgi:two-component system autoinducer 1 sensor kinase/phosphatase LuxN